MCSQVELESLKGGLMGSHVSHRAERLRNLANGRHASFVASITHPCSSMPQPHTLTASSG
jgi:hypothetical protein